MNRSLIVWLVALASLLQLASPALSQFRGVPVQNGTIANLPATCGIGEWYWATDATAGSNLYFCTSVSTWTAAGGATGANTALSNLAAVSINTSLLAQTGVDLGSTTKPFRNLFIFGAGTFGTTYHEITGTPTSTRVWTLPDVTDTFVGLAATQTLTGKTLTTPIIAQINDANGNAQIIFTATGSAVDQWTMTNGATGSPGTAKLDATGTDSGIIGQISAKGSTGYLRLLSTAGLRVNTNGVTGGTLIGIYDGTNGADTNIRMALGNFTTGGRADVTMASGSQVIWTSSATNAGGTKDAGLSRNNAGIVEVNSGTAGTFRDIVARNHYVGSVSIFWSSGTGSPEGAVTAPVGSLYSRSDGGAATSLYVKETGAGNTGWVGK